MRGEERRRAYGAVKRVRDMFEMSKSMKKRWAEARSWWGLWRELEEWSGAADGTGSVPRVRRWVRLEVVKWNGVEWRVGSRML